MARRDPYLDQAGLEAQVKYQGAEEGLAALMSQAIADLQRGVQVQESAAAGVKAAVQAARPQVADVYKQGGQTLSEAEQDMRHDLSTLSASADPYRAISAREAQSAKSRLAIGLSGALRDLSSREVQAEEGRQYGVQKSLADYQGQRDKIAGQSQSLARERGSFTQLTASKLRQEQAEREEAARQKEMDRQNSRDISAASSAASWERAQLSDKRQHEGQNITRRGQTLTDSRERAKAGQPTKEQTAAADKRHRDAMKAVNDAYGFARSGRAAGLPQKTVLMTLASGDSKRGVPRFSGSVAQAAVDLVYRGSLTSQTAAQLAEQGLRVPAPWKPRSGGLGNRVPGLVGRAGSIL